MNNQPTSIHSLPDELISYILVQSPLGIQDILAFCSTAKIYISLFDDEYLWHRLYQRDEIEINQLPAKLKTWKQAYISEANKLKVSSGSDFMGIINKGVLYMWGLNDCNQICSSDNLLVQYPKLIELNEKIHQVCCGNSCTLALTKSGKLYIWGSICFGEADEMYSVDYKVPTRINLPTRSRIISMSCNNHIAIVTENGQLYMFGPNEYGQLANGPPSISENGQMEYGIMDPILVPFKEKVSKVSCGGQQYTAILTRVAGKFRNRNLLEDGNLYVCGNNEHGQLGIGYVHEQLTPVCVPSAEKVIEVSCGKYHTAAITETGKLYTWGDNEYGELGRKVHLESPPNKPGLVHLKNKAIKVVCNAKQTGIITEDGAVYLCGLAQGGISDFAGIIPYVSEPRLFYYSSICKVRELFIGTEHIGIINDQEELHLWNNIYSKVTIFSTDHPKISIELKGNRYFVMKSK